jgi:hypothetical protein
MGGIGAIGEIGGIGTASTTTRACAGSMVVAGFKDLDGFVTHKINRNIAANSGIKISMNVL